MKAQPPTTSLTEQNEIHETPSLTPPRLWT